MLVKQIIFKGRDDQGNVLCQPILGEASSYLEKTAAPQWSPSNLHPVIQRHIEDGTISKSEKGIYVLVSALGAGEFWGSNVNGDYFPEGALTHSPSDWLKKPLQKMQDIGKSWEYGYPTFMGAHPYKHHVNKDPSRAFGHVVLSVWNPRMHRVELVIFLDKELCKKHGAEDVYDRIENGEFPDVSMGCKVPYDRCSICDHKSKTTKDYCFHAKNEMNRIYPDGRKVCVINDFPRFFDISFVFIGADKSAKMLAKLASVNDMVCMGDYCTVPRLSADVGSRFSGESTPQEELESLFKEASLVSKAVGGVRGVGNVIKDMTPIEKGIAGGIAVTAGTGLYLQNRKKKVAEDPARDKALAQWRRQKLGEMYGVHISNTQFASKTANDPIKEKLDIAGVPVWLEWKPGDLREYKDKAGRVKFSKNMKHGYGYIPDTKDADGEEIDVYLGENRKASKAWVIKQLKADGKTFDENKVMMGFDSMSDARASYDHHMGDGAKERFGGIKEVPVSALKALFGENGDGKEKAAGSCNCDCGGSCQVGFNKVAEGFGQKSASHAKLSEITKIVPAGPFRKAMLPTLEKVEGDLPKETIEKMAEHEMSAALSTSASLGIVLKPHEFQRLILVKLGESQLADRLAEQNITLPPTQKIDNTYAVFDTRDVVEKLAAHLLPFVPARSIAGSVLEKRASVALRIGSTGRMLRPIQSELLEKIAELYNGYRQDLVKKAGRIDRSMVFNPHLSSAIGRESLVMAFAGGIMKTAHASVLGPESLAYLVGAHYEDREFHLEALAQSGVWAAA